jgi:hypothetical protein
VSYTESNKHECSATFLFNNENWNSVSLTYCNVFILESRVAVGNLTYQHFSKLVKICCGRPDQGTFHRTCSIPQSRYELVSFGATTKELAIGWASLVGFSLQSSLHYPVSGVLWWLREKCVASLAGVCVCHGDQRVVLSSESAICVFAASFQCSATRQTVLYISCLT